MRSWRRRNCRKSETQRTVRCHRGHGELSSYVTMRDSDIIPTREQSRAMANTKGKNKEERKKARRAARKKRKAEKPLQARTHARGSAKRKVKKMIRGQAKR